ncbi:hypothetical protein BV22DRAFT_377539 [Leucogyrophana mollusca]|uniref:Uncharacterized protein n=1 Tax=Leucogyrophana mollusca TaxID=85980 RepID=A0ACB8BLF1_9AGAM|nr:hypothetical protein BV22DRAFT_377539 [Leucogyrophana mollusca]
MRSEVYNILVNRETAPKLPVRESDAGQVFIADLTCIPVESVSGVGRYVCVPCILACLCFIVLSIPSSLHHSPILYCFHSELTYATDEPPTIARSAPPTSTAPHHGHARSSPRRNCRVKQVSRGHIWLRGAQSPTCTVFPPLFVK